LTKELVEKVEDVPVVKEVVVEPKKFKKKKGKK